MIRISLIAPNSALSQKSKIGEIFFCPSWYTHPKNKEERNDYASGKK
jgi:hypothetical protein